MKKYWLLLALLSIVIFSVANVFTLYSQSIRLDESQSLWQVTKPIPTLLNLMGQDVHPPLYALLLHFWVQLFGTNIIYARALSFIFFLGTIPGIYIFSKDASNKKIATLAILLFSLSPFVAWYSNEARMYTLFTFVTSINHIFFMRLVHSRAKRYKLPYVLSTIVGLYTHYFFNLLVMTQVVFVFLYLAKELLDKRRTKHVNIFSFLTYDNYFFLRFVGLLFTAYVWILPWLAYVYSLGQVTNETPLITPPSSYNLFQTFANFLFGFQSSNMQAVIISLWPLLVIFIFFIFTQRKKVSIRNIEYFLLVTFLPVLVTFAASYVRPIFLSRYLIFVTPTLFFLIAWILMNYSKRIAYSLVGVFFVIMLLFSFNQNSSAATPVKEDYKDVVNYLDRETTPQDIIALSAPFTIYPVEYLYNGRARITTVPEWNRYNQGAIPPFSQENLQKQIEDYKKQYARIFLVLSYDQGYEKNIIDYMDKHYQRLKLVQYSPGLELRIYKLRYNMTPLTMN